MCQIQLVLIRFVDLASNSTSEQLVGNEGTLPSSLLNNAYCTYECINNNLEDTLNNSSNILFGVRPLSYVEVKTSSKRKSSNSLDGATKRQNNCAITKGWVVYTGGTFSFTENLSKQPCRNYATEGLSCSFSQNCQFEHKVYPKGFRKIDQATICDWVKKTNDVEFAAFVNEADRNVKYSPFKPKVSITLLKGLGPPAHPKVQL